MQNQSDFSEEKPSVGREYNISWFDKFKFAIGIISNAEFYGKINAENMARIYSLEKSLKSLRDIEIENKQNEEDLALISRDNDTLQERIQKYMADISLKDIKNEKLENTANELNQELKIIKEEKKQIDKLNQYLENNNKQNKELIDKLNKELENLREQNSELKKENADLKKDLGNLKKENTDLNKENIELKVRLEMFENEEYYKQNKILKQKNLDLLKDKDYLQGRIEDAETLLFEKKKLDDEDSKPVSSKSFSTFFGFGKDT